MDFMRRHFLFAVMLVSVALVARSAPGWTKNAPYERMAPLSQYLMADRQAEIKLARTAAPKAVSQHATVLILTKHGYETAEKGANGFTCLVERAWTAPLDFPEFWNWKNRSPLCYNPPASRSVLLYTLFRTKLILSGMTTKSQLLDRTKAAVASKQLPVPEPGSMTYMLSKQQYLNDGAGSWMPHLMFYAPKALSANGGASWGANVPGSPVIVDSSDRIVPEPETIFMVPVAHWSDGSPAPRM